MRQGFDKQFQRSLPMVVLTWLACVTSVNAQNARVSASNITPIHSKYIMTVVPPNPEALNEFIVPSFNGKLQHGNTVPDPDRPPDHTVRSNELAAYRRGDFEVRSGFELYLNLLRLGENRSVITPEAMESLYTSGRRPPKTDPLMHQWAGVIEKAARGGLSDGAYREVFCVPESPCPLDRFNGARPYDIAGITPVWGNAHNEFRFRAAYALFVEKYLQELIDWGAALDREVAMAGTVRLGQYNFNLSAYELRLSFPGIVRQPPEGFVDISTPEYSLKYTLRERNEVRGATLTWKLPREQAQALREKLSAMKSNQLYFLVDGKIGFTDPQREAMQNRHLLAMNHHVVITGKNITFFYDPQLTEQAAQFALR